MISDILWHLDPMFGYGPAYWGPPLDSQLGIGHFSLWHVNISNQYEMDVSYHRGGHKLRDRGIWLEFNSQSFNNIALIRANCWLCMDGWFNVLFTAANVGPLEENIALFPARRQMDT